MEPLVGGWPDVQIMAVRVPTSSEPSPMRDEPPTDGLDRLAAHVREDLARTSHPAKDWMPPRPPTPGKRSFDVVIAGAGQGGLALAHALKRDRVTNILVIDRAPYGREGVWMQYARMPMLRSPKEFTGPDLGLPSLTYQSWHEARFGAASWAALGRIPKEHWNDYLLWYRRVLELPVENETELVGIAPRTGGGLDITVRRTTGLETLATRKLVLATGQDGTGAVRVDAGVRGGTARRDRRATTADDIDFAALSGKVVAVLGQGASAAPTRPRPPRGRRARGAVVRAAWRTAAVPAYLWLTFAGFFRHIGEMPDAWRWRFMRHILNLRESFPQETYDRMRRHSNFTIHRGAGWTGAQMAGDRVRIMTAKGPFEADFLICGTGIDIDPARRPELAPFADRIATWRDRYTPPAGEHDTRLGRFAYHAPDGSFLEKVAGTAPFLADIHDFTIGTTLSFGPFGCSINAMNIAVPKLAAGITRSLFAADLETHWRCGTRPSCRRRSRTRCSRRRRSHGDLPQYPVAGPTGPSETSLYARSTTD